MKSVNLKLDYHFPPGLELRGPDGSPCTPIETTKELIRGCFTLNHREMDEDTARLYRDLCIALEEADFVLKLDQSVFDRLHKESHQCKVWPGGPYSFSAPTMIDELDRVKYGREILREAQ